MAGSVGGFIRRRSFAVKGHEKADNITAVRGIVARIQKEVC